MEVEDFKTESKPGLWSSSCVWMVFSRRNKIVDVQRVHEPRMRLLQICKSNHSHRCLHFIFQDYAKLLAGHLWEDTTELTLNEVLDAFLAIGQGV